MQRTAVAIALGIGIAWSETGHAQGVPGSVSFTARLVDNGNPVTGTRTFDLKLFDAETGGTEIWTETHAGISVAQGLAFLEMGSISQLDPFTFDGASRWLQISVNGTILTPRLPIVSVPYAIRAGVASDSEALGGRSPSDFLTGVTAGDGLTGGGSSGDVTIDADPTYLQRRVGACTPGAAITSIAEDGTPSCALLGTGDITSVDVASGGGLVGGATSGDASIGLMGCLPGEILKYTSVGWGCAADDGITSVITDPGSGLTGGTGSGDADLALISCASGETLIYGAAGWSCGVAGDIGGITTAPGSGLAGGVTSGTANLSLIPCAPDQVLRATSTGWVCDYVGDFTRPEVQYDTGWFAVPQRLQVSLTHGVAGADFAFGWVRSRDETGAEVIMPAMGAEHPNYATAYNEFSSTSIGFQVWDYLALINDPGDRYNVHLPNGEMRLRVFDRDPSWDSGWQPCAANNTYTFLHGLGTYPHFAHVEVAQNSDGSGWRVPAMNSNGYDGTNWRQTSMVALSATNVSIRTHTSLGYFYRNGSAITPSNGYCRVRLYVWTPDYDSGWVSVSTTVGNRDKLFMHNLGQFPSLVNLYVAQNSDGSGWALTAMGAHRYSYSYGSGIYHVGDRFAVIKGGGSAVAHFVDSAGGGQGPASGYLRFMAWR